MATTGDPTDSRGTKRPNEGPIIEISHTFKPIIVAELPQLSDAQNVVALRWLYCYRTITPGGLMSGWDHAIAL